MPALATASEVASGLGRPLMVGRLVRGAGVRSYQAKTRIDSVMNDAVNELGHGGWNPPNGCSVGSSDFGWNNGGGSNVVSDGHACGGARSRTHELGGCGRQRGPMNTFRGGVTPARALICVAALVVSVFVICGAKPLAALPTGTVSIVATGMSGPIGIAPGPDGSLWFTDCGSNSIGRITTAGVVTSFTGTGIDCPEGIASGPDGNVWFTNGGNDSIGRVTPAGVVSNFAGNAISQPRGIAAGPDGNMWFTNFGSKVIGQITPSGVLSYFTDYRIDQPYGIAAGPDGNMWFTDFGSTTTSSIGRISPTGTFSFLTGPRIDFPQGIAAGPDGNMWFTRNSSIERLTPAGVETSFTDPEILSPGGIAAGPDGNMWFTNNISGGSIRGSIGRITPAGVVSTFTTKGLDKPVGIAMGSDRNMWFTNQGPTNVGDGSIGRVSLAGSYFHSLAPVRVLDSRGPNGGWNAPLVAGTPKTLSVTGAASIPAGVDSVVMNVTVTGGTANSYLTVYPDHYLVPNVSNLNFAVGQTTATLVTVKVGDDGQVAFANAVGATDVVADIVGYYDKDPGDRYNSVAPARILDSRNGTGSWTTPLSAGTPQTLSVTGAGGVPATADAVVINVTVTNASRDSFLTVYPEGSVPNVSNLNFAAGQTTANLVTVKIGVGGRVAFANRVGSTDVVADIAGYFDPATGDVFHSLYPTRTLDSRTTTGAWTTPLGTGAPKTLPVAGIGAIPDDATAVIGTTTVTNGSTDSFLTVYPAGAPSPTTSNINFSSGQTTPNLVAVKLGLDGAIEFNNEAGSTDVVFDQVGFYSAQ